MNILFNRNSLAAITIGACVATNFASAASKDSSTIYHIYNPANPIGYANPTSPINTINRMTAEQSNSPQYADKVMKRSCQTEQSTNVKIVLGVFGGGLLLYFAGMMGAQHSRDRKKENGIGRNGPS